jgi:hypothetical protein
MRTRIRVAITVVAVAAGTALFIGTPGAVAIQSQPVLAGAQNTADFETLIVNTSQVSLNTCFANSILDIGLMACGYDGVRGLGSGANGAGVFGMNLGSTGIGVHGKTGGTGSAVFGEATANGVGVVAKSTNGTGAIAQSDANNGTALKATALNGSSAKAVWGETNSGYAGYFSSPGSIGIGVRAIGGQYGVLATTSTGIGVYGSTSTGTGVNGITTGATGIGVNGKTFGSGSAVFGEAVNNGVAVFGKTTNGTALRGDSPSGTALEVNGKAKFSRSGTKTVAVNTASLVVNLSGTTANSMILATAQQNTSVFVKAVVPAAGSFTIYLTGNAPAGGLKVAYFVMN